MSVCVLLIEPRESRQAGRGTPWVTHVTWMVDIALAGAPTAAAAFGTPFPTNFAPIDQPTDEPVKGNFTCHQTRNLVPFRAQSIL